MKPIVIAILGGLTVLLFFSCINTNNQIKTISANKTGIIKSIIKPAQQNGIGDIRLSRLGF